MCSDNENAVLLNHKTILQTDNGKYKYMKNVCKNSYSTSHCHPESRNYNIYKASWYR